MDIEDFYIKYEDSDNYNPNKITINTMYEMIIGKLQVVLLSVKGDVLGDSDLGCNLEYYVQKTNVSSDMLEGIIRDQINKYIPEMNRIGYKLSTSFIRGEYNDMALIDIELPNEGIQILVS